VVDSVLKMWQWIFYRTKTGKLAKLVKLDRYKPISGKT